MELECKDNFIQNRQPIDSISDYVKLIELLAEKLNTQKHSLWFRGVENSTYRLVPSAMRASDWRENIRPRYEYDVMSDFINQAKPLSAELSRESHNWNWYIIAQHYGLPTRLLDWSTGALVGLFFALWGNKPTSPTVWVVDPYKMNLMNHESVDVLKTDGDGQVYFTDQHTADKTDRLVQQMYGYGSESLPKYPIAITPSFIDARVKSQRGAFTVSGTIKHGIEELAKRSNETFLARIRLTKSPTLIDEMKNSLIQLGVGPADIYPDLEGLCKTIKFEWEL